MLLCQSRMVHHPCHFSTTFIIRLTDYMDVDMDSCFSAFCLSTGYPIECPPKRSEKYGKYLLHEQYPAMSAAYASPMALFRDTEDFSRSSSTSVCRVCLQNDRYFVS